MSVSLVFHLIKELLIGLVLDLDQDKCGKNRILFVLLIKKLVSSTGCLAVSDLLHGHMKCLLSSTVSLCVTVYLYTYVLFTIYFQHLFSTCWLKVFSNHIYHTESHLWRSVSDVELDLFVDVWNFCCVDSV